MSAAAEILLPLAHLGHWWTYVLYAVPVIIVLGSVVMSLIKERRASDPDEGSPRRR